MTPKERTWLGAGLLFLAFLLGFNLISLGAFGTQLALVPNTHVTLFGVLVWDFTNNCMSLDVPSAKGTAYVLFPQVYPFTARGSFATVSGIYYDAASAPNNNYCGPAPYLVLDQASTTTSTGTSTSQSTTTGSQTATTSTSTTTSSQTVTTTLFLCSGTTGFISGAVYYSPACPPNQVLTTTSSTTFGGILTSGSNPPTLQQLIAIVLGIVGLFVVYRRNAKSIL